MCHDPQYLEQLQEDLEHFTRLAESGNEAAARSADETALELQRLGVKLANPPRPLFATVDARTNVVDEPRTRMGFVRT